MWATESKLDNDSSNLGLNSEVSTLIRRKSGNPWLTSKLLTVTGFVFNPCKPLIEESIEKLIPMRDNIPTAVLASALAEPERWSVWVFPTVVAATNWLKIGCLSPKTANGTLSNVRCITRVITFVLVGAFGNDNWANVVPSNPMASVCSRAEISIGKSNGRVNAASVELLLVDGLYAVLSVNKSWSWLRLMDLMMLRTPRFGNAAVTWRTLIASLSHVTWQV